MVMSGNVLVNGNLIFDQPWVLFGIAVLLPVFLYNYFSPRERRIQKILPRPLRKKLQVSRFFFELFLAFLIASLAGPRWGVGVTVGGYKRAADVVIAVDVSHSMEIGDAAELPLATGLQVLTDNVPSVSRLERGLSVVREAVADVPDIRYAIALSRNRGIVAVPLTWDNGVALGLLEAIDASSLTGRGTDLEALIDTAASAFSSSGLSTKEIILVSDGEALTGSLKAALVRCGQNGITVSTVAVGSDEGAPLPGENTNEEEETISRRDSASMQNAAMQTGGIYIDGNSKDAAGILSSRLRSLSPEAKAAGIKKEHKPRWFLFAILAIMAYGMSKLCLLKIPEYRKKTQ
jgi:Ca-activated chloride channel family protein